MGSRLRSQAGFGWGAKVTLPKFFILGINVTKDKASAYTAPEYTLQDPEQGFVKRRIWSFKLDNVPTGIRDTILATGRYDTTVATIKPYVRHKNTDEEADFNG